MPRDDQAIIKKNVMMNRTQLNARLSEVLCAHKRKIGTKCMIVNRLKIVLELDKSPL